MRTLYLDTETTGLQAYDELVELALIDDDGRAIIDTLLRPVSVTSWLDAQRIHGITPEMVREAPTLADVMPKLLEETSGARVVIYNAAYDLQYLPGLETSAAVIACAMLRFAEHAGDWNDYRGSYRWHKLDGAARSVQHKWDGAAHRAKADALACRSVWQHLERVRPRS